MDFERLDEVKDKPAETSAPEGAAPPVAATGEAPLGAPAEPLPPPLPAPQNGAKGFPQLVRFLWGGIIVLAGTILPFGGSVVATLYGKQPQAQESERQGPSKEDLMEGLRNAENAPAPAEAASTQAEPAPAAKAGVAHGYETFTGALFLLLALMLIGQMRTAIAARRVALGAVLLMFLPAGWAWYKLITVASSLEGFSYAYLWRVDALEQLTLHVGSGFILVLIGSSWVVLNFLITFVRALTGAGASPAPAAAAARGRARRR